ncbi:MAG: ligand-binding protein SH3 [Thermoplasmata archaeon]|nr:MAG: ligand-binding protein SH3 [Thermoplasmata archaeon]
MPWWGKWLSTIIIAMLPIIELRGALPAATNVFGLEWGPAILLSIIGNMLPIPFIMIFFGKVERFLRRWRVFNLFFDRLFASTRRKGKRKMQVWGDVGLILFVAIPLPVTGAWTGALAAYLLKLERKKALLSIFVGVVVAGFIVTLIDWTDSVIWAVAILMSLALLLLLVWKVEEILIGRNSSG